MSENANDYGVLVIDDHAQDRELVRAFLEPASYRVSTSAAGDAGLRAFDLRPADVVLLDASRSLADALTLCSRIRQLPSASEVIVVLVVAAGDATAQRDAADGGADDVLLKPLHRTELLSRLRSLLRARSAVRKLEPDLALARLQRDAQMLLQRQREETIALLVHDMKNPLAGVLSNAEFLVSSSGLDGEQSECVLDILHASRRLHRMVLSLLDVSQSEFGALRPLPATLELSALMDEARALSAARLRDKSLELSVVLPEQSVRLRADADMLLRLLANLLDGAARAAPPRTRIEIDATCTDVTLELRVHDSGAPIPMSERGPLFESYVQLQLPGDDPEARGRRSLGMSSCRVLAEAHGGRIWVEDPPAGATICVSLPLA